MAEDTHASTDAVTKVAVTVAALAAAFVAERVVTVAWRTVTGASPSRDDSSPLAEVLTFAAVSAASIAVARAWATRKARAYMTPRG